MSSHPHLLLEKDQDESVKEETNVLIIDTGYSALKITSFNIKEGIFTCLNHSHLPELGSNKIDQLLLDYFAKEFCRKSGVDVRESRKSSLRLLNAIERTKTSLSNTPSAQLFVESLADGMDWQCVINRGRLEMLCDSLFKQMQSKIMEQLETYPSSLILINGASASIPLLQQRIHEVKNENQEMVFVNDPLCVYGAAYQAELLRQFNLPTLEQTIHLGLFNQ